MKGENLATSPITLSTTECRVVASCCVKKGKILEALSPLANYAWGFLDE